MQLSRFAVNRPVTIAMIFLALVVLGAVSYRQLPVQLLPDFTVPTVGVYMAKPGAGPTENLDELTKPVEGIIAELPRIKEMRSWTGSWGTWIRADFEYGTDIRFTTIDLQERLNAFQQDLKDRRTTIQVFPFSTDSFKNFLMSVSLEGPDDESVLREIVRSKVETQIKTISGVAKVEVGGLTADAADIELDPTRLVGYGLRFENVFGRIQSAGVQDNFLGKLRVPGETHYVLLDEQVRNVDELRQIAVDENGVLTLEDVAMVTEGATYDGWIYRANGNNAIGIQIDREEGENLIEVAQKVRTRIDEINATLPPGTALHVETDIAEIVEDVINQVRNLALVGAALALIVPLVFFKSWRIASIIFISVPICIIAVFNLFFAFGMSINIFSIIGLALGVGMLVDNSIVVVENCFRLYFGRHLSALRAAELGGGEVGRALLASTLTTAIPFVALFFVEGEFKLFIKEPALALIFPLLLSLVTALSLSAMLTAKTLRSIVRHRGAQGDAEWHKAAERLNPTHSRVREVYRFLLKASIRHRARVLFVITAMLAFVFLEACSAVKEAPTNREQTDEVFRLFLKLPPGNLTSETSMTVAFVEDRLLEHEDIKRIGAWFRGDEASFDIHLKPKDERPSGRSMDQVRSAIVDFVGDIPGAEAMLNSPTQPMGDDVLPRGDRGQVTVKGLNKESVEAYAARFIDAISVTPDILFARIQREDSQPEYHADIDREKSGPFGVTGESLGQYVGITRSMGQVSSLVLKDGDDRTDVTISIADSDSETLSDVKDMPVYAPTGSVLGLGDLTKFRTGTSPTRIYRADRQTSLQVEYLWTPGADQGAIQEAVKRAIRTLPNPAGVVVEFEGTQKQLDQRQQDFSFVIFAGMILIYVVMAAVFESYWVPFTIIATNPLIMIGVVVALYATGLPFDDLAGFGVILLIGLAVNNGIVLMDQTMRYQHEHNYRSLRAIFQAADQRLRPILMTFMTTFLGLLPMAISGDETSQWRPVAVTVLGGLTSATFLTLLVLPCFYLMGEDFVRFARPGWLAFWAWLFRLFETISNALSHAVIALVCIWKWRPLTWPKRIWRGMVIFIREQLPTAWRWTWHAIKVAFRALRSVLKMIFVDPVVLLRENFGNTPKASENEPTQIPVLRPHSTDNSVPTISVGNLHVIFPTERWRVFKQLLPSKQYPFGHRPLVGLNALDSVDLEIKPGLFGLLGPNGAGKTTLMRCVAGLIEPTRGTVRLFGIAHREAPESLAPLIGYLPQNHGHYEWMTLREYLDTFALLTARTLQLAEIDPPATPSLAEQLSRLAPLKTPEERCAAIERVATQVHLEHVLDRKIKTFSGGMKQRAGIARVLLQAPPIVIVDEPTAGLDPIERVKIRLLLAQLAHERTVIFSTHIVEDLEDTCTQVGVLERGRLLFCGAPEELRAHWNERVWQVPIENETPEKVRETLLASDAHVLFRYARGEASGWRCLSEKLPHPRAEQATATLEDALLGMLMSTPPQS